MSLLTTASLVITPNAGEEGTLFSIVPDTGLGDMSVTRATTATRVNSAGLVELVPYNLFSYSEQFENAYWSKSNATIIADNITAPDGTSTADRLTITSGFGAAFASSIALEGYHTISCFFKKGDATNVYIDTNGTSGNIGGGLNLDTLATTTWGGAVASVEDAGNGWLRFSIYATFTGTASYIAFGIQQPTANLFTYIWGAQLNEGTIKPYQKTETRLNIPRLDYSNGTCPSLLVEPQRTNFVFWSNNFSTAKAYNYQNASQSSSTITAPDGLTTTGITSTTSANDFHRFFKSVDASSATYTSSIYAKKGDSRYLGLGVNHNGSATKENIVVFDLQNGVIASNPYGVTATIEDANNGWYRLTHTFTYTGATAVDICVHNAGTGAFTTLNFQVFDSPTAPTTLYIYGLQFELGSYATSYIPTTSASVTRNADVISKTGISSLIGQTEGTIFGEVQVIPQKTDSMLCLIATLSAGTYANFFYIRATNGIPAVSVRKNDTTYVSIDGTTALSEGFHKFAFAYKQNDFAFYVDGVLIGTDTSGEVPLCDEVYLGNYVDGFDREVSKKSFALWKTRLTNTQLSALTTI